MQKKLIALAVAGLVSAPVFAQSNVTIYGIADAALGFGSSKNNDYTGVVGGVLSGNRIGFRGTEDLGNGLKAVFQLENGFDIGNGVASPAVGGDSVFSRQAYVGLQGAFGTVSLGRQYAPGYFANYDAALAGLLSPQSTLTSQAGLTITPNSGARWDNSVVYTGTFGAVSTRAIYSAFTQESETLASNESSDDRWGLGVDYANGPVKVGAVYHSLKQVGSDSQKEWYVGGEYNFGVLALAGSYQSARDFGAADTDKRVWNLGVMVPVGAAGKVLVSYGNLKERDLDDRDVKNWMVGYTHALSKRSTAYAGYNRTSNDDAATFGALNGTIGAEAGEDAGIFVVGMRHAF